MVLLVFFSFSFSPFPENNSKVLVNEDYSEDSLDTKWLRSFSRLTKRNLRDLNFVITGIQDQQDSTWKVAASTGPNETIIVDGEKRGATEVVVLLATQWTAREPRWAASIEIVKQRQKVWLETTRVQDFSLLLERYWFSSLLISFARYHSFVSKKATRERERALLTFRNISLVFYSPPFIEHQVLVITTYIEGNSIFVLGPAETKFMSGEIYQPLKRNISLKRFHCFAFFLEPLSQAPTFEILSPVSPEWIFLRIFSSKVSRFNDAILCKREYSNIIIIL